MGPFQDGGTTVPIGTSTYRAASAGRSQTRGSEKETIKTLRNKAIAHTDLELDYDAVFEAAGLTAFELRDFFTATLRVVNLFEDAPDRPLSEFRELPVGALRSLLRSIP